VSGRFGWLTPAGCRLAEQGLVLGLVTAAGGRQLLPGAYAVLAVAAFRAYDVTYRQRLAGATVTRDRLRRLGWPVRVVLLALVVAPVLVGAVGTGAANLLLVLLAAVWFAAALRVSARWWFAPAAGRTGHGG
jgi:hypothetical protein